MNNDLYAKNISNSQDSDDEFLSDDMDFEPAWVIDIETDTIEIKFDKINNGLNGIKSIIPDKNYIKLETDRCLENINEKFLDIHNLIVNNTNIQENILTRHVKEIKSVYLKNLEKKIAMNRLIMEELEQNKKQYKTLVICMNKLKNDIQGIKEYLIENRNIYCGMIDKGNKYLSSIHPNIRDIKNSMISAFTIATPSNYEEQDKYQYENVLRYSSSNMM